MMMMMSWLMMVILINVPVVSLSVLIFFSQWGCRPFVRKNVEVVCSFFIRYDSIWMVWLLVLLSFGIEMAFRFDVARSKYGRLLKTLSVILCQRKKLSNDANFCKTTSPYFSTGRIPVLINYFFVVAGLKWMASSVVFVTAWSFFYLVYLCSLRQNSQDKK